MSNKNYYYKNFFQYFSAVFIAKFIAFLKEILLGWVFGTVKILDNYFFLTSIANLLNATWNKTLETTILQVYQRKRLTFPEDSGITYLLNITIALSFITFAIVIILNTFIPHVFGAVLKTSLTEELLFSAKLITSTVVVETLMLSMIIYKYINNNFFITSILPVFQNVVIIVGLFLFKDINSTVFLALFYFIGTTLQLLFLTGFKKKLLFLKSFSFSYFVEAFKLIKKSTLLMIASGISTLNIFVDQSFAMSLFDGAVSYIHYGAFFLTIYQVLVVKNINTIFFPQFQEYAIKKQWTKLQNDSQKVIKILLLFSPLIWLIIINNGRFFLNIILGYGKMTDNALHIIYYCLLGYSLAFLGAALYSLLIRILHVFEAFRFIFYISLVHFGLNLIFNYLFLFLFGIWGIPLSTSITFVMVVLIYFIYLFKKYNLILINIRDYWYLRFLFFLVLFIIFGAIIAFIDMEYNIREETFNILSFLSTIIIYLFVLIKFKFIKISNKKFIII